MKYFMNIFFTILVVITSNIYSMDYFQHLPDELQVHIISLLADAETINEAITSFKALALTNKKFNQIVNDGRVIKQFLDILHKRFPEKSKAELARMLGTKAAYEYLESHYTLQELWLTAIKNDDCAFIKYLYEKDTSLINYTKQGSNALRHFLETYNANMVAWLLTNGASIAETTQHGTAPIRLVYNGDTKNDALKIEALVRNYGALINKQIHTIAQGTLEISWPVNFNGFSKLLNS